MDDEPNPAAALAFERELARETRQLGRQVIEHVYNQREPAEPESLPHYVHYEAGEYRRLNRKTPNREVATLFGKITLWRHGYRRLGVTLSLAASPHRAFPCSSIFEFSDLSL